MTVKIASYGKIVVNRCFKSGVHNNHEYFISFCIRQENKTFTLVFQANSQTVAATPRRSVQPAQNDENQVDQGLLNIFRKFLSNVYFSRGKGKSSSFPQSYVSATKCRGQVCYYSGNCCFRMI